MKKKVFAFLLFLEAFRAASISHAQQIPICGQHYIPFFGPPSTQKSFEMLELIKGEITFSPFEYACQSGIRKSEVPGFFKSSLPNAGPHGNNAQDFIRLVAEKAKSYLARNQQQSESLLKCIDGENLRCEEKKIREIQEAATTARSHLALMQALEAINGPAVAGKPDFTPSSSAAPNGLSKAAPWDKYTEAEYEEARQVAKEFKKEAIAAVKRKSLRKKRIKKLARKESLRKKKSRIFYNLYSRII